MLAIDNIDGAIDSSPPLFPRIEWCVSYWGPRDKCQLSF